MQPLPSLEDLISSVSSNTRIISPPPSSSIHRQQTASSPSHPQTFPFPRIIRANNAPDSPTAQSPSTSRADIVCIPPLSNSPTRTPPSPLRIWPFIKALLPSRGRSTLIIRLFVISSRRSFLLIFLPHATPSRPSIPLCHVPSLLQSLL